MKRFARPSAAYLAIPLLALTGVAGSLSGQSPSKPAPAPAPQLSCPSAAPGHPGSFTDVCAEQLEERLRTIDKDLQSKLAELQKRLAKMQEDALNSPGFSKWQEFSAQWDEKSKELESRAEELAAHAQELAEEATQQAEQATQRAEEATEKALAEVPEIFANQKEEGSGWLGIEIAEVTPEKAKDLKLPTSGGVLITDVQPDSPAAKAGLKENDVITQFDGQPVTGTAQFRGLVLKTPAGRTVALGISRNGAAQTISVELGDRSDYFEKRMNGRMRQYGGAAPPPLPPNSPDAPGMPGGHMVRPYDMRTPVLGINGEDISGALADFFDAPDSAAVLVREVVEGTPADRGGLKAGDVIIKVDDDPVHSLAELRDSLRAKADQKTVNVSVLRKGEPLTLQVAIEKPQRPYQQPPSVRRSES